MLAEGRDLLAVIRFGVLLGQARERLAERVIAGEILRPQDLAAAETEAAATLKREFYNPDARKAARPGAPGMSDEADYAARGQRFMEEVVLANHRGLLALPVAGDPALGEDRRAG